MFERYKDEIAAQAASLSVLPAWYPFFANSVRKRREIGESKIPGNLSHSTFFSNPRNCYRGMTLNLAMQPLFPYSEWLLNTLLARIEKMQKRHPILTEKMLAAFFTGATTVTLANPYEVTLIAAQKHSLSPYRAFIKILNEHGPRGFYTGAVPMANRNGCFMSGLFVTSGKLQQFMNQYIDNKIASTAVACSIQATLYTTVAIPLDIAAVMRQSDPSKKLYSSSLHALKLAYKKHGFSAFKTGALMRLLASTIELTGFNLGLEEYKKLLNRSNK